MLDAELERLTRAAAPKLVALFGVGPDSAGALLVAAGDNPDRLRSNAAFVPGDRADSADQHGRMASTKAASTNGRHDGPRGLRRQWIPRSSMTGGTYDVTRRVHHRPNSGRIWPGR